MLRFFNRAHFKVYSESACGRMLEEGGFVQVKSERFKINWLWGLMTATGNKPQADS